jgi:hypothetical protein
MSKHAMMNLDSWKTDAENIMKTKQSELTVTVFQKLRDQPLTIRDLHNFLVKDYGKLYDTILESKMGRLKDWFSNRDGISFDSNTQKFFADGDKIMMEEEESYKTPSEYRIGQFKVYSRKDDDLNLVIKLKDTTMSWTIDINSDDDIFNLFGKAGKFPAQVSTTPPIDGTVVDEGEIELGVQRAGYHEYFLKGNKFETKLHVRVVPVDEKEMWLAWTGYKQTPADREGDEGLWNINEDKYSKLVINTENE